MGTIEHCVQNPMTQPIEKYVVFDGYGRVMALTKQQNDIEKNLVLFNNEGKRVFSMKKSINKFRDSWEIEADEHIDKRLTIFMPIFVSSELGKEMI